MTPSIPLVLALVAQQLPSQVSLASGVALEQVRSEVVEFARTRGSPSLTVGVARHGRILLLESYGWADRETHRRARVTTVYPIGSMSKAITAAAALKLIEQGRLGFATPVDSLLRGPVRPWDPERFLPDMRVGHLLDSTAGIPHGWLSLRDRNAHVPGCYPGYPALVAFPPGDVFDYSNHSFGVLQAVIEAVTGQSFQDALQALVLGPSGMTSTTTRVDSARLAAYAVRYRGDYVRMPHTVLSPAGGLGLYSSAVDLLRFGTSVLRTWREPPDPAGWPGADFFRRGWWRAGRARISNGSIAGANSHLSIVPDRELVVVALTNMWSSLADEIAHRLLGRLETGIADETAASRADYERRLRTAYAPRGAWTGAWRGELRTPCGKVPFEIAFGEHVSVTVAHSPPVRVGNATLNETSEFRGVFSSKIPGLTPEGAEPHSVRLMVRLADGRLTGYASAMFDFPGGNASVPAYLELRRDSTKDVEPGS